MNHNDVARRRPMHRSMLLVGISVMLSVPASSHVAFAKGPKVQIELGASSGSSGPAKGPPAHAPAHGYRKKFSYHYYPRAEVYHDVERGLWFYTDGRQWKAGAKLPLELGEDIGGHVRIELESESPWVNHRETREAHPKEGAPRP